MWPISRPLRVARRSLRSGVRVPSMCRCSSSLGRLWMKLSMISEGLSKSYQDGIAKIVRGELGEWDSFSSTIKHLLLRYTRKLIAR